MPNREILPRGRRENDKILLIYRMKTQFGEQMGRTFMAISTAC